MKTKSILMLAMAVLTLGVIGASAAAEIGHAAPDFSLPGADGKNYSPTNFKGKWIVLEWTNHDCPFVRKHYGSGHMQALQKKYTGEGVVWLRVISSAPGKQGYLTPAQINEIQAKEKAVPTATLIDSDGKVGHLYGAQTTPHLFVINPQGNVVYMGAIDDKPTPNPADIATAKNYVAAALDESLAGKPVTTPVTKSYGCSIKY